jgi:D-methionine transport system permease protein
VVANALDEIDQGRIDALDSMGVSIPQLVFRVLLPEARSGLIAGSTLTLISIIGNTAVASIIGSGGLGDFAIKYGYQRYNDALMYATVAVLIVMVQIVQVGGDLWLRKRAHRR